MRARMLSKSKNKINKDIWLEKGMEILSTRGPQSLTIDNLVTNIGKTKGAFYHHFKSCSNYAKIILEYWLQVYTKEIIDKSKKCSSSNEKLKTLLKLTLKIPRKTELAIRSWALYNPVVRKYQKRMDKERLKYLIELYSSVSNNIY